MVCLVDKIEKRFATIGVVGAGYVGLPLAVALARTGFRVTAVEVSKDRVDSINEGRSYIRDISSELLATVVRGDDGTPRLIATTEYEALASCDVQVICVPTPFDRYKTPDLDFIVSASQGVAEYVMPGCLVVVQSTTYPGTTEELVKPILEKGGLRAGVDFHLAFSPERLDPGNERWNTENTPRVVGGITPQCARTAKALFQTIAPDVHIVYSTKAAEMTKLLENVFRSVNIALVNELALLCEKMGLDIFEVIRAASTKPFGFMPFYPGPGVGGHCIPVDPYYLSWKARDYDFHTRFIEMALEINEGMPDHALELVARGLGAKGVLGAKIMILGVAFKPEIDDVRNSPAERLIKTLLERGGEVSYHDPYVNEFQLDLASRSAETRTLTSKPLDAQTLAQQDCVVIAVAHNIDYGAVVQHSRLVVDLVNATSDVRQVKDKVLRLGVDRSLSTWDPPETFPGPSICGQEGT